MTFRRNKYKSIIWNVRKINMDYEIIDEFEFGCFDVESDGWLVISMKDLASALKKVGYKIALYTVDKRLETKNGRRVVY